MNCGRRLPSLPARTEGITLHRADGADAAAVTGDLFSFEKWGQDVVEVLQLELRDRLTNETFDGAEVFEFLDGHQRERIAHFLGAARPADAMHIIFGMLR